MKKLLFILALCMPLCVACSSSDEMGRDETIHGLDPAVLSFSPDGGFKSSIMRTVSSVTRWEYIHSCTVHYGGTGADWVSAELTYDKTTDSFSGDWFTVRHTENPMEIEVEVQPYDGVRAAHFRIDDNGPYLSISQGTTPKAGN